LRWYKDKKDVSVVFKGFLICERGGREEDVTEWKTGQGKYLRNNLTLDLC
jgi:hypothetical protein